MAFLIRWSLIEFCRCFYWLNSPDANSSFLLFRSMNCFNWQLIISTKRNTTLNHIVYLTVKISLSWLFRLSIASKSDIQSRLFRLADYSVRSEHALKVRQYVMAPKICSSRGLAVYFMMQIYAFFILFNPILYGFYRWRITNFSEYGCITPIIL